MAQYEDFIERKDMGDIDNCNLIINFLPLSFKETDLMRVFQDVGRIKSVRIMKNRKTAKSKGYGFVKYERVEDAEAAIQKYNGATMMGKNIKVAFSRPGGTRTGCNLFVSNLPKKWTNNDFHIHFSEYGLLLECRVLKNNSNESRRCGFVRFDQAVDAQRAMKKMDGYIPNGAKSAINVKLAERPGNLSSTGIYDKKKHEKNPNSEWTTTTIDHNFYHQRQPQHHQAQHQPQHQHQHQHHNGGGEYNMPNLNFPQHNNPQVHSLSGHVGHYMDSPYEHVQDINKVPSSDVDRRRNIQNPESLNMVNNAPLSPISSALHFLELHRTQAEIIRHRTQAEILRFEMLSKKKKSPFRYNNLNMYSMPFSPLGSSFPGGFSPSPPIPLQSPMTNFMFPTFDPCGRPLGNNSFSDFTLTPADHNHHPSPISPPAMTDNPFNFSQIKDALPTEPKDLSQGFNDPLAPSTLIALDGPISSSFERPTTEINPNGQSLEPVNTEETNVAEQVERQKETVFVSNIPLFFDEANLSNVFSQYGDVKIATLQHDNNGYSLGMGFVSFAQPSSAARAVQCLNGTTLYDRKICVRF